MDPMKLSGVRVLDLSSFIPGPLLTLAMADHGAEVIKIEAPGGDPAREIGECDGPHSVFFRNFNRGKKSMVLNLKHAADRETFMEMADQADVIVESNRPGVAARLGIGYDTLHVRNPRLIYCSISAFGQTGPHAQRPAHDLALQAIAGAVSLSVGEDGRPVIPPIASSDFLSGLQGLSAVLMALYARERTGMGDYIDISMQESLLAGMLNLYGPTLAEQRQPAVSHERSLGGSAFYRIYDTADQRQLALGGQEIKFVRTLLGALDRLDLAPLCERGPGPHQQPVIDFLKATFAGLTLTEATRLLSELDICWAPVNTLVEALDDAQLAHREFILKDAEGRCHIGPPIRFKSQYSRPSLHSPLLGEQTGSINDQL
jgi:crotonobetainyl-CoA:carnitine CoA-transferase CaiB-like acyl-CoA transferase